MFLLSSLPLLHSFFSSAPCSSSSSSLPHFSSCCLPSSVASLFLLTSGQTLSGSTDPQEQEPFTMCVCVHSVPIGQTGSDGRWGKRASIIRIYRRHWDTSVESLTHKEHKLWCIFESGHLLVSALMRNQCFFVVFSSPTQRPSGSVIPPLSVSTDLSIKDLKSLQIL